MRIYLHQLGTNSQSHYRSVLPARHCQQDGLEFTVSQKLESLDYDAFVLPRLVNPNFVTVIENIKQQGKKIIWELDDDVWNVPSWNPASRAFTTEAVRLCNWMADTADHITVSTEPLAAVVKENTGKEAVVLPNLVDLDEWPALPPREAGPVKILWAGSQHHEEDIKLLVDPLNKVIDEYGDKVQVLFFGDWPAQMSEYVPIKYTHLGRMVPKRKNVGFVEPVPLADYPRTMAIIRPDIGLAPLTDCKFNNSKSNIKLLEYAMCGAATIAHPRPPYDEADVHVLGDSWQATIKHAINNQEERRRLAEQGRDRVMQNYSWQNSPHKQKWLDFWKGLA